MRVLFTQRVSTGGGLYLPGEVAADPFIGTTGEQLVRRGLAVPVPEKAPSGPPADKMVARPVVKK